MRGFLSYNGGGEHKMQTNRKVFFHIRGSAQCSRMWSVGNLQRACAETDSFEGGRQYKFSINEFWWWGMRCVKSIGTYPGTRCQVQGPAMVTAQAYKQMSCACAYLWRASIGYQGTLSPIPCTHENLVPGDTGTTTSRFVGFIPPDWLTVKRSPRNWMVQFWNR